MSTVFISHHSFPGATSPQCQHVRSLPSKLTLSNSDTRTQTGLCVGLTSVTTLGSQGLGNAPARHCLGPWGPSVGWGRCPLTPLLLMLCYYLRWGVTCPHDPRPPSCLQHPAGFSTLRAQLPPPQVSPAGRLHSAARRASSALCWPLAEPPNVTATTGHGER